MGRASLSGHIPKPRSSFSTCPPDEWCNHNVAYARQSVVGRKTPACDARYFESLIPSASWSVTPDRGCPNRLPGDLAEGAIELAVGKSSLPPKLGAGFTGGLHRGQTRDSGLKRDIGDASATVGDVWVGPSRQCI